MPKQKKAHKKMEWIGQDAFYTNNYKCLNTNIKIDNLHAGIIINLKERIT